MNLEIIELKEKHLSEYQVEDFIFKMIKESYGLDYVPEYHFDVIDLKNYYINPSKNNLFMVIDKDNNQLIATAAVRGYDRNDNIKNRNYNLNSTASIYRLFVKKEYRHNKIATRLLRKIEDFCREKEYNEIYLHTQKDSYGALAFWLHQEYEIVDDTHDSMGTIHMEKVLNKNVYKLTSINEVEDKIES
ncbi:GNAT family N-acetyltransferase [Methanosphaera sp. BMS]|uniref:GNAT family N-acetyltransferase n=1 Tax=Methanosphaera sp. BMS TaxID=1789762 RepID=UPI000DC1F04A|nr:GNAT family N-acetyltransferase [Methanosphaera sp. BMS]AWX32882.1 GNAT family acetyltransferase [Methanosphaera sp. BMS]